LTVKSGKRRVSIPVATLVVLAVAANAGHENENGTGAMWIAPELVAVQAPPAASACSQSALPQPAQLRFEMLDPADIEEHLARPPVSTRAVVDFEWNAASGELSFQSSSGSTVFSDLAPPSDASGVSVQANCGSR
jgi:hypothetical protein